eukprot:TRINITY_DN3720_c0_g1_i1.p2 TRINITY_DN3720_c0_g1~~TRINITY_DN3720_c0_g1_i1.p2  ORF type:complete len:152 (-),score=21.21 TRINITY_DN3720_c0_g1_i1:328-783(-)
MKINTIDFEDFSVPFDDVQERPHQFNPAEYARAPAPDLHPEQPEAPSSFDESQEPPLLEELGIDPVAMRKRFLQVFKLGFATEKQLFEDTDMSGPIFIVVLFGIFLMLVLLALINRVGSFTSATSTESECRAALPSALSSTCCTKSRSPNA